MALAGRGVGLARREGVGERVGEAFGVTVGVAAGDVEPASIVLWFWLELKLDVMSVVATAKFSCFVRQYSTTDTKSSVAQVTIAINRVGTTFLLRVEYLLWFIACGCRRPSAAEPGAAEVCSGGHQVYMPA